MQECVPHLRHSAMVRLSSFSKEAEIQIFRKVNPPQLQILATLKKRKRIILKAGNIQSISHQFYTLN